MDKDTIRYHEYLLSNGFRILAGKSDIDNDALTFQMTTPSTWWFHVHGMPGSHVILISPDNDTPDKETLNIAASVAAYHSKARNGGVVPVVGTRAEYIRKPRGAKAGTVSIRKETLFKVRPGLPPSRALNANP